MTVKELKQKLKDFPEYMEIYLVSPSGEHYYGLVQSVEVKTLVVNGDDQNNDEDYSTEDCLIITEE